MRESRRRFVGRILIVVCYRNIFNIDLTIPVKDKNGQREKKDNSSFPARLPVKEAFCALLSSAQYYEENRCFGFNNGHIA
jgi:hypothetical protein